MFEHQRPRWLALPHFLDARLHPLEDGAAGHAWSIDLAFEDQDLAAVLDEATCPPRLLDGVVVRLFVKRRIA